jgi:hypothetical protein
VWWNGSGNNAVLDHYELRAWKIQRLIPSEVIHFRYAISNASPFGLGLLHPLVTKAAYTLNQNGTDETRQRAAILDIKRRIEDMTWKIMARYQPRNVYNPKNANVQQVDQMQATLNVLEDEQDFVVPGEMEVIELGSAAKAFNLEQFTSMYVNPIIKAIGTPTSRLFEKGALTEASAKSAKEVALMRFMGFQNNHKRILERFLIKPWYQANPVYDANGVVIPWDVAKISLNWGLPERAETPEQIVVDLFTKRAAAFSDMEVRKYASDNLDIELDDASWQLEREQKLLQQQQMMMQQGKENDKDKNKNKEKSGNEPENTGDN